MIIKIAILGYETEVLFEKIYRSFIWTLFLPQGVKIELIFALRPAVSEIRADFENYHIWARSDEMTYDLSTSVWTLFLAQRVEIELIFALRQPFTIYGAIFVYEESSVGKECR